jgi:hypothetical protein
MQRFTNTTESIFFWEGCLETFSGLQFVVFVVIYLKLYYNE